MKTHVVLIDQNKKELAIFMKALEQVGDSFKCTYAESGEQALEILRYLKADFIFADQDLPGISGLQFIAAARLLPQTGNTKIYLYAFDIDGDTARQATLAGASGCMERSCSMDELMENFRKLFSSVLMPLPAKTATASVQNV